MIIGCLFVLEKVSKSEKMFNFSVYHIAHQQGCVRSKHFDKWHMALSIHFIIIVPKTKKLTSLRNYKSYTSFPF